MSCQISLPMHQLAVMLASFACAGSGRRVRSVVKHTDDNLQEVHRNSEIPHHTVSWNLHGSNRYPLSLTESKNWQAALPDLRHGFATPFQAFNTPAGPRRTGQRKRPAVNNPSVLQRRHRHLEPSISRRAFLVPALASALSANLLPRQGLAVVEEQIGKSVDSVVKDFDPEGFDARFESGRIRSQSVGITQKSPLLGKYTFVWGLKDTCDPLDPTCTPAGNKSSVLVQSVPPETQKVTDRVRFDISLGRKNEGSLTLGLWREAAPDAVDAFVRLSKSAYTSQQDDEPASYRDARVVKIKNDRIIQFGDLQEAGGQMRLVRGVSAPQLVPCAAPVTSDKPNGVSHDAAGYLSVRRGGGSFDFFLTTRSYPDLDRDNIVIGELVDEASMRLLERLNRLPVNRYSDGGPLAPVKIDRIEVL